MKFSVAMYKALMLLVAIGSAASIDITGDDQQLYRAGPNTLLYFAKTGCGRCQLFERTVLPQLERKFGYTKFLKWDFAQTGYTPAIPRNLDLKDFPVLYFINYMNRWERHRDDWSTLDQFIELRAHKPQLHFVSYAYKLNSTHMAMYNN